MTLAGLSIANMTLAGLDLPRSLCPAKNCEIAFLKLTTKVYSLIWLPPTSEAEYQGLAIKVLKSSNPKPRVDTLINLPIQN